MSTGWADQRERGNRLAVRTIRWIALHLGRPAARLLLYPITAYFLVKAGPQRAASRRFLSLVSGRPAGLAQVARHIHCFAATILDRVFLIAGRRSLLAIRLHGQDLATARIAAGKGVLLLGSHLGSFELLRALGVEDGQLPLKILMQPEHNQIITTVLEALNPRIAQTVIPLGSPNTLLAVKEALDAGCAVGILGDRRARGEPSIACRFFDRSVQFPLGPLALAAVTGVPVLLFFGLYRGGNRYDVYFEHFADRVIAPRPQRREILGDWVQRYAARLEHHTRAAPYNWFNYYDFWGETQDP